jgi:hypothetical protein
MYSEDRYHPTNNDDTYLSDLIQKKIKLKNKNPEENYCEFFVSPPNLMSGRKIKIKCYRSGEMGSPIVDAVTGAVFSGHDEGNKVVRHTVGSKYENLYFKTRYGSNLLFYHSPGEFEKHQYTELPEETKRRWRERFTSIQYEIHTKNL